MRTLLTSLTAGLIALGALVPMAAQAHDDRDYRYHRIEDNRDYRHDHGYGHWDRGHGRRVEVIERERVIVREAPRVYERDVYYEPVRRVRSSDVVIGVSVPNIVIPIRF